MEHAASPPQGAKPCLNVVNNYNCYGLVSEAGGPSSIAFSITQRTPLSITILVPLCDFFLLINSSRTFLRHKHTTRSPSIASPYPLSIVGISLCLLFVLHSAICLQLPILHRNLGRIWRQRHWDRMASQSSFPSRSDLESGLVSYPNCLELIHLRLSHLLYFSI